MEGTPTAGSSASAALVGCLERLLAADIATADRVTLDRLVGTSQRLRAYVDAVDVQIATRAGELATDGSAPSAADVLANHGRCATRDARRHAARAEACRDVAGLADALGSGTVSSGHVDAVVTATAGLDTEARAKFTEHASQILDAATTLPVEQFATKLRRLAEDVSRRPGESRQQRLRQRRCVKRWVDRDTGMSVTHLELDAEGDAKVWSAIRGAFDAERERNDGNDSRSIDQQLADALVALITSARSVNQRVPEVSVLIDLDTLRGHPHGSAISETADGEPLDADTIRRLGCDGDLVAILLGEGGVPLSVGRTQRLATREQRQAARALYHTCGFPDCTVPFEWTRLHHVASWTRDHGATDFDNLLPLCSHHHHLVHEGGWNLELDPNRTITVHQADGSDYFTGDTTNRRGNHHRTPP